MSRESISQSHLTAVITVGARVVIRMRLPEAEVYEGGPHHTDVVGEVRSFDEESVVVETRRGEVVVPRTRIVLAKQVPPAPVRRPRRPPAQEAVGIDDLQALMTAGMPPLFSLHLGGWLLRAANGYTGRANSTLPIGDPGCPLEEAIRRVADWYAEHGQPALVQLPHAVDADPRDSALGSLLAQRNWRFFTPTLVMTKPSASAGPSDSVRVEASAAPTDDWWATSSPRSIRHRETLTEVLARVPSAAYLTAYVGGSLVGHARLAFGAGWSGVFDVHTDPAARRRGVGRALMRAAGQLATEQRIPLQYLQVDASNEAAVRLYESLGWHVHHTYHYATPRPETDGLADE